MTKMKTTTFQTDSTWTDVVSDVVMGLFGAAVLGAIFWHFFVAVPERERAEVSRNERDKRWSAVLSESSLKPNYSVRREAALDALSQNASLPLPVPGVYQFNLIFGLSEKVDDAGTVGYDLLMRPDGSFELERLEQRAGVAERSYLYEGNYKFAGKTLAFSRPERGQNRDLNYGVTRYVLVDATTSSFTIQNDSAEPLRFTLLPTPRVANAATANSSRRQDQ